jgi:ABC-type spermidine/putrescine transport system permease subunit I
MSAQDEAATALAAPRSRCVVSASRKAELAQILPLLLLFLIFFDAPLMLTLGWSFREGRGGGTTIGHYLDVLQSPLYLPVVWRTFFIAGMVTSVCALLGYPLALWMSRLPTTRQLVALGCVIVPFWVSILVRTYAWIVVLGNGGMVNRALQDLGLTETPISFLYNEFGVVVGMTNVLLPYLVLPLYAAMLRVDNRLLQVAATLGASARQIFWRVYLPITLPALAASMVLVFILSLGFYITPAILGGGKVPMVANMMDYLINRYPRWELAATISVCLLLMTLLFYWVYQWVRERAAA